MPRTLDQLADDYENPAHPQHRIVSSLKYYLAQGNSRGAAQAAAHLARRLEHYGIEPETKGCQYSEEG